MQIDKQEVVDFLRKEGKNEHIQKALQKLPDKIDHEQHAQMLQQKFVGLIESWSEVTTVSNAADDLWEEMDRESDKGEAEERDRPNPDEPWAKTSKGDTDNVTSD